MKDLPRAWRMRLKGTKEKDPRTQSGRPTDSFLLIRVGGQQWASGARFVYGARQLRPEAALSCNVIRSTCSG